MNEEERELVREAEVDFLEPSYNTYESTSQCINRSVKWRNCHIIDIDLIYDHNEGFY